MKNFKQISALVLIAAAVGCASTPYRENYAITAKVTQNGVVLGEPSMLVEPGTTATVSVDGAGAYNLALNVKPTITDDDRALVDAELRTREENVSSSMVVELGEPATISIDDVDLVILVEPADRRTSNSRTRVNSFR